MARTLTAAQQAALYSEIIAFSDNSPNDVEVLNTAFQRLLDNDRFLDEKRFLLYFGDSAPLPAGWAYTNEVAPGGGPSDYISYLEPPSGSDYAPNSHRVSCVGIGWRDNSLTPLIGVAYWDGNDNIRLAFHHLDGSTWRTSPDTLTNANIFNWTILIERI